MQMISTADGITVFVKTRQSFMVISISKLCEQLYLKLFENNHKLSN